MTREFIDKEAIDSSIINTQNTLSKIESSQKKRRFGNWIKNFFRKLLGKKKNEPKRIDSKEFSR